MTRNVWIGAITGVILLGMGIFFMSKANIAPSVQENRGNNAENAPPKTPDGSILYVPIGDSYTIGNGLLEEERWPNLLTQNLQNEGIPVVLAENPAVSGWTVNDAYETEIPVLERVKPGFVTVLIGANDVFRNRSTAAFEQDLQRLLDRIEEVVPDAKVLMVTIPDYTVSPAGLSYGAGPAEQQLLQAANGVIRAEAESRGFAVADLTEVSREAGPDESMFIDDGLHPSAAQMELWERVIFEEAKTLLKESSS